ncbi:MAG TPA: hypothetical protein VKT29_18145 [Terriglobales bacterium]|nr:hypothetical protein [Terriglobales bacterium]
MSRSSGGEGDKRITIHGWSLVELCVVLAIMLVVAGTFIPATMMTLQQYQLRTAATGVATMLQNARMESVRLNRHYTVQQRQLILDGMTYDQLFLDENASGSYDPGEPFVQLPRGVRLDSATAPSLPAATLGFTPQSSTVALSFNGMGLPCVVRNAVCTIWDASGNAVGVVYFMRDTRAATPRWAAVSVSPGGRAHSWRWSSSGSKWLSQ